MKEKQETYDNLIVGERIKECRVVNGFTQDNLAEELDMKRTNISNYEHGRSMPPSDVVFRMSVLFNVSTDYLLGKNPQKLEEKNQHLVEEISRLKKTIKQVQEVVANDVFAVLSHSID